jgi:hypothetical protein
LGGFGFGIQKIWILEIEMDFWKKWKRLFLLTEPISLHYWADNWVLSLGGWQPGANLNLQK